MLDRVLNPVLVTVEIDDDDDDEEDGTLEIEAKPSKVRDAIFDVMLRCLHRTYCRCFCVTCK